MSLDIADPTKYFIPSYFIDEAIMLLDTVGTHDQSIAPQAGSFWFLLFRRMLDANMTFHAGIGSVPAHASGVL